MMKEKCIEAVPDCFQIGGDLFHNDTSLDPDGTPAWAVNCSTEYEGLRDNVEELNARAREGTL